MAATPKRRNTNAVNDSTNVDGQDTFVLKVAERVRERAGLLNLSSTAVADAAGIKRSAMTKYWSGERAYPTAVLTRLADALRTNVDWLLRGESGGRASLVSADDADWIAVPEYNLREVSDESLGERIRVAPIRKDWLHQTLRTSSDLWLAQLLSEYRPAGLEEGALVICRTISQAELAEGYLCLWRVHGSIAIGRFSIQPDVAVGQGIIGGSLDARYAIGSIRDRVTGFATPELIVSPSQIGDDEGHYHLVGRIMGSLIRPL